MRFEAVYHNGMMEERTPGQPLGPTTKIDGARFLTGLIETRNDLAAFLAQSDRWRHPTRPGSSKRLAL